MKMSISKIQIGLLGLIASILMLFVAIPAQAGCTGGGLSIPQCGVTQDELKASGQAQGLNNNPIIVWINFFVNLLTVVIVAGSALMIAIAGIQYTTSRDNSQAVQSAKGKIWNVALGLLAYLFLYAFVQWLIPGGVF